MVDSLIRLEDVQRQLTGFGEAAVAAALPGRPVLTLLQGEMAFPVERRFGHLQLDDLQLYARSFVLEFDDTGSTRRFWP